MDEIGAIKQRLRESQDEMLSTLQQLIGINSEAAEPEKDCPFMAEPKNVVQQSSRCLPLP